MSEPVQRLLSALKDVRQIGERWEARCPVHPDGKPSLCIAQGGGGRVLVKCQAGCETKDVLTALGLKMSDLFSHNGNGHAAGNGSAKREIVATYDYRDEAGELLFQAVRFEPKGFAQRRPKDGGGWDWSVKGVRQVPYRLPEVLAADSDKITLTPEGEKDCDRLWSLGLPATCNAGGAGKWRRSHSEPLSGRRVAVLVDNDDAGRKHGQQVARSLQGLATSVKVVALPGLPPKGDVSDWLDDGHTVDELLAIVEAAPEWEPKDEPVEAVESSLRTEQLTDGRQIIIGTDEPRVIDEAVETLATRDNVFVRGGYLVHIIEGTEAPRGIVRPREAPRIAAMRHARIRELLAAGAEWLRPNAQDELERVHPPDWAVKAVDARGEWPGIRVLEAAVESLVLRADGSVLQQKGYDPATGIMFLPQCEFPAIAEKPTRDDAIAAGNSLLEVVEDFPFASEEHSASWVAGVLTPLARYAFRGPSPLFLHDANVRGCGKSLLTDTVSIITTGREMARMSLPRDDDELRKRITSLAMAGEPLILIDNIAGTFGSPSLDAALTATSWSDRILGQSAMAAGIPMFAVWFATGNNVVLAADTARRVVHIRLESPEETPEERTNFHHPDLLAWVRQERPRLTAAAVTILAGYCAAGRPDMKLRPWGSYEGWSDLIRQAVVWVGMVDPGASRRELASVADREAVALRQLLENWHELDPYGHGITLSQVIRELTEHPTEYDGIRTALLELAPPRDGKTLNPRSVGMKLHHLRRRVVGGRFLDNNPHQKVALWFIRGGDSGGTNGTSGSNLGLTRARLGAHTHENLEGTGDSPISPASPATCQHATVDEQDTFDGFVNLVCHDCGAPLGCREERVKA